MCFIEQKTIVDISKILTISYSSVYRIWKEYQKDPVKFSDMFSSKVLYLNVHSEIKEKLIEFINNKGTPFTITDVKHFACHKIGVEVKTSDILKLMKSKPNLSFKRISSRPVTKESDRVTLMKKVFCNEYGNLLESETLIANIDEATYSRTTRINYSWGRRGKWIIMQNSSFNGSTSIILAITSKGDLMPAITSEYNNSKIFIKFLKKLIIWLRKDIKANLNFVKLLMDNSPIHWPSETENYLGLIQWKTLMLPPYSPEFAPIELTFGHLKWQLWKHSLGIVIRLNKNEGESAIKDLFSSLSHGLFWKLWIKWMKNIQTTFKSTLILN